MSMLALGLGLAAALAWGVHDVLLRRISQGPNVVPLILVVLVSGLVLVTAAWLALGGTGSLTAWGWTCAGLSGAAYVTAMFAFYRAFDLAPVRLVAPVLGAYPLLSLLFAAVQGRAVSVAEWLAVTAVVAGIALGAVIPDDRDMTPAQTRRALAWAVLGAAGFAVTFLFGQIAARSGDPFLAAAATRGAGLVLILAVLAALRPSLQPARTSLRVLLGMGIMDGTALSLVIVSGTLAHAEYASVASSLFGVVSILLAARFLGEKVKPVQWIGIALVFGGIARLAAA